MNDRPNQERVLDTAERLCQTRGFNGFSFRDLADIVGIRSASIHYYFPTKADLGKALIVRYRHKLEALLGDIERRESSAIGRFHRFVEFLLSVVRDENRLCLCGILAAEACTLSDDMRAEIQRFFYECESWIVRQLNHGQTSGELNVTGSPAIVARTLLAGLEGAMVTSRAFNDQKRLEESAQWLLAQLLKR